ncbi:MAG: hypothetical protein QM736_08965 [Vicinamibacterales bacterium]
MASKATVVQQLGETALLLPDAITAALSANDRLKYYLTLLQAAKAHALQPHEQATTLRAERENAGVADVSLDTVVSASRLTGADVLACPAAGALREAIVDDLATMIRPFEMVPDHLAVAQSCRARLAVFEGALRRWSDDALPLDDVSAMAGASDGRDSVHQLVMDLHREVNRLQASIARESIRRREELRRRRGGPGAHPRVHGGCQPNSSAQARSSRAWYHGHTRTRTSLHPERSPARQMLM